MTSEPERECERMSSFVRRAGGLDFVLLGVGMNGHLALNEPHAGLDIPARRVKLDAETVRVSEKYFSDGGHAPEYGITLGVPELLGAREVWITIFGEHKRETSRRLLDPETRAEDFPAAAALSLERAVLVFDRAPTRRSNEYEKTGRSSGLFFHPGTQAQISSTIVTAQ